MTVAIVAGAVANKAGNAGAAWTRLSWAVGLLRLGFDVHVVEQLAPGVDADAELWFSEVIGDFGLTAHATLLRSDGSTAVGLATSELAELADEATLLVNISGHLRERDIVDRVGCRVFVDLDPGYTQLWHADGTAPLEPHDHWYTVGSLVGSRSCALPTGGLPWRPIRQPVVLDEWPVQDAVPCERFTTVGSWRGAYGPVAIGDRIAGGKVHEFRNIVDLPHRTGATFELCLDIDDADHADRENLEQHGWQLRDPRSTVGDPQAFRRYVQTSSAEFSVAQAVYVQGVTGWFGDRSVRYLASGRPVLVQDTGCSQTLPVGEGLLTFRTMDEACAGVERIAGDHEHHAKCARAIAEDLFAAERVLGGLCEEVGVAP